MPSFLDLIKGEGVAIGFIRSAFEQGLSASETLTALRESGKGLRTQTFYQIYNYYAEQTAPARSYFSNITLNAYPNINRIPESLTKQLRNFAYYTKVTGIDVNTGEIVTKDITVSTNELLTKQQAADLAVAISEKSGNRYGLEGASAKVTDVTKNQAGLVAV